MKIRNLKREEMQIGDFARRAGVSVRAVRYYEELGLLHPSGHSQGGFRLYGEENFTRLEVINFLKELGLPLIEIRRIMLAKKESGGNKTTVRTLLSVLGEKLKLVDCKLETLTRTRDELANTIDILRQCESCENRVLLESVVCSDCPKAAAGMNDTFKVILQ